jgi:hypothetical protein
MIGISPVVVVQFEVARHKQQYPRRHVAPPNSFEHCAGVANFTLPAFQKRDNLQICYIYKLAK